MAAGIGSRFGEGIKLLAQMGSNGEIIMDYSIQDAKEAGFNKVVFIILKDIFKEFEEIIGNRIKEQIDVEYVFQELDDLPEGFVKQHDFLVAGEDLGREFTMGMGGFILKNTLSDNGTVTRGVSVVDENGLLSQVHETTEIEMGEDGQIKCDSEEVPLFGFSIFHQRRKVCIVHLIQKVNSSLLVLIRPINQDVKVISSFGRNSNKLLIASKIIHQCRIPLRCKCRCRFCFFHNHIAVIGRILCRCRRSLF